MPLHNPRAAGAVKASRAFGRSNFCADVVGYRVMTQTQQWYFVWLDGPRGPEPQKWSPEGLWGQIGRQDVIVRFPLSAREAKLSIDELAKLHPLPGN